MDNKITKRRLSNFLAYDWILIIVIIALAIFGWELILSVSAQRLSVGRQFKLYYDENISSNSAIYNLVKEDTFSFDIIYSEESLTSEYNVLEARLSIQEGDIIITDCVEKESKSVRTKSIIDSNYMYILDDLLADAKEYLAKLDTNEKIRANFISRMDGDNRFRKDEEIEKGVIDEIARIEKLRDDVLYFETFLNTANDDCFYTYTRFSQAYDKASDKNKADYERYLQTEKDYGRENARYGINFGALSGGEENPTDFVTVNNTDESAEKAVILVFNFKEYQPDLQYETISFLTTLIKTCGYVSK